MFSRKFAPYLHGGLYDESSFEKNEVDCPMLKSSATSYTPLGSGGHMGYERVVVHTQEDGAETHRVHRFDAFGRSTTNDRWPTLPRTSENWRHGEKLSTAFYNDAGQLVRRIDYSYKATSPDSLSVHGFGLVTNGKGVDAELNQCINEYKANAHEIESGWRRRTEKSTTYYEPGGSDSLTVTKAYEYDETDYQIRTVTKTTSNGRQRTTRHRYAYEEYGGMGPGNSHQLSQRYRTTVFEDADGDGQVGSNETVWKRKWKGGVDPLWWTFLHFNH